MKKPPPRPGRSRWPTPPGLVPHPRFGSHPHFTDVPVPTGTYGGGTPYRYEPTTIIEGTVVCATPARQLKATVPYAYYLDVLLTCRRCDRPFIFFALEQQHWYEELGFSLDAWTNHCSECRKLAQADRRRFHRYADAISQPTLDDAALAQLLGDALAMWQAGRLTKRGTLERLLGRGRRQLPDHAVTAALQAALRPAT